VVDKQLTLSLWNPQESIAIQPLDRIERSLNFLSATTAAILDGLPVQRRPLAESTKALHLRVTCLRRNGYCSCCQRVRVCLPPAFESRYTLKSASLPSVL
jgi:hypothetical protein